MIGRKPKKKKIKLKCPRCYRKFKTIAGLREHIQRRHPERHC